MGALLLHGADDYILKGIEYDAPPGHAGPRLYDTAATLLRELPPLPESLGRLRTVFVATSIDAEQIDLVKGRQFPAVVFRKENTAETDYRPFDCFLETPDEPVDHVWNPRSPTVAALLTRRPPVADGQTPTGTQPRVQLICPDGLAPDNAATVANAR
jgi:hypothetical protein